MLRKTLEAKATTTTDLGEFTALAATYGVDRTNERILPGAFKDTIQAWQEWEKMIPLHWDHMGEAANVIGTVDPASMKETADGLQVSGKLDLQESPVAKDAWRLMKKNAVALSFGYLVTEDAKAKDGVRELKAIDLFEITITPAPANPETRFLNMKSQTEALLDPDAILLAPDVIIEGTELKGAQEGDLKAVWTASYVNDLPDSAFLHVESGGSKDADGKTTPRSLRHFPYQDAGGMVDLPHLRNALARIPQSNLSQSVKDELTAKAQAILDKQKAIEGVTPEEPARAKVRTRDPLKQESLAKARETRTEGLRHVEVPAPEPEPESLPSRRELKRRSRQEMLDLLRG